MTVEPYACICALWKEASASGHEASLCLQNYVSSLVLMEHAGFSSLGCVSSLVLMERAGLASLNCLTPTAISFSFPLWQITQSSLPSTFFFLIILRSISIWFFSLIKKNQKYWFAHSSIFWAYFSGIKVKLGYAPKGKPACRATVIHLLSWLVCWQSLTYTPRTWLIWAPVFT